MVAGSGSRGAGAFGDDLQRGLEGLIAYVPSMTWPSSDPLHGGQRRQRCRVCAIIAHPARRLAECGLGNPAAMDTVKGREGTKGLAR
jgi:hypothetical protein